ncbi:MAG TPA: transglycosylase SLT domain-containing protein [Gemmatimonadaceae bacterium]|nr:transglycosylase SLT domain-containing protein [Gemmatimonadaceae bacterium]
MLNVMLHALVLAATLACQQGDRREAAGEVAATLPTRPGPIATTDADVRAAQVELAEGRAAKASKLVMAVLRTPERRTPEALLVAARAAAEWRGWTMVHSLLAFEPWIDGRFDGEARELLARSALERNEAEKAREHASAALRAATAPTSRAVRLTLLARAYDRLNQRDSAAALYQRAADLLPAAREWLLLRAAGSISDVRARERLYAKVKSSAARARVPHTEAQTLERLGMHLAAADAYEKLGDIPSAYRLRLASDDRGQRSTLRAGLLGYIQRDAQGPDLQRAFEVLDAAFPDLDATSELIATRRAAEAGVYARAAAGFARIPAAQLTDADVIVWARALLATGNPGNAASRIAARRFGAAAASEALYLRGLGNLRAGRASTARTNLRQVVARHRATRFGSDALYLLADMESDAGRDASARDLLAQACLNTPAGGYSDNACFRSGILSLVLGNATRAASAFEEIGKRFGNSAEAIAALYWSGRAWERAGNAERARERWQALIEREPYSYYAGAAAKRLGQPVPVPPQTSLPTASPDVRAALVRAEVLDQLGMDVEERYEYEGIEAHAGRSADEVLGAGAGLVGQGEVVRAIRLGWRVVTGQLGDSAGPRDARGYALVYPLLLDVELVAHSRANRLDPALVAAVIRQESSWNPRAVSRAGARGLMQIMPTVGQAIARSKNYPMWDPALLFDPGVSLELGTSHLRAALSEHSTLPRALAAYNAGGSRVRRWIRRGGTNDPEIFIERIPFVETRDYVRIVMRNTEMYRALHGLTR